MHLCCELANVAKYAFFGVIFWLKNGGLGNFFDKYLFDSLILVLDAQMVTPFFNLCNFLYIQMHSDFPTHEGIKENLIFILFSKICDSFLRQPCEREPEPYRGLHWPYSLPLRNAVEF